MELLGTAFLLLAFTMLVHAAALIFEIVAAIRRPRANPSQELGATPFVKRVISLLPRPAGR